MAELAIDNNQHLYYELIEGDPRQPYLVFLHEGLGCSAMWKQFPLQLCHLTSCPGLLYDRLGYGNSSPLAEPRTITYVHDYALIELPELLSRVTPEAPHILIGHSDGGSIALIYGAQNPPQLKGIITEAAHIFIEPITAEGIRRADQEFEAGSFQALYKYHGDKTQQIFKAWSQTWLSAQFLNWNIENLLSSVVQPMLVLQGTNDEYATRRQFDLICTKSAGPSTSYLIEQCGHTPHKDNPDQVLQLMAQFIRSIV
ncbi:MAG: alpha/beta hydrolase [Deltaproteobacteria bacterium]|nr:alpha/beta hydrolase [Deltaproteobacteria bacterium]